jgi:hypothetical protein
MSTASPQVRWFVAHEVTRMLPVSVLSLLARPRARSFGRSLVTLCVFLLASCSAVVDFGPIEGETPELDGAVDPARGSDGGVSDRGCQPGSAGAACARCEVGQFCAGGGAKAVSCPDGQWDHDQDPATACTKQRSCEAGEFVSAAGSATVDRACTPCASGRFSASSNAATCEPWERCEPGEYVSAPGTISADQKCGTCADGTMSDAPNSGRCVPLGSCGAGSRMSPDGCVGCAAGEYCGGEDMAPVACGEGTWDHDSSPASPCVPWSECGAGMFASGPGSATADRVCQVCPTGSFTSDQSASACAPWSVCAAGQFVSVGGTPYADRVCTPCADGSYSTEAMVLACTPMSDCQPGQRVGTPGTATADRVCVSCEEGTFSSDENASACTPWTVCKPMFFVKAAGSASADQTCEACPSGTFSSADNSGSCAPQNTCAAGTKLVAPGSGSMAGECGACGAGEYCAGGDAPAVACERGSWDHDQNPASPCVAWSDCGAGQQVVSAGSATTNRTCRACAPGTFSAGSNAQSCSDWTTCGPGSRILAQGSVQTDRTCTECGNGSFSDSNNALSCSPWTVCGAGRYVTAQGSGNKDRSCEECANGTFTSKANQDACQPWTDCSPGKYVAAQGTKSADRSCANCAAGTFSDQVNASQCVPPGSCGAGTKQTKPATPTSPPVCEPCVAGQYCPGGTQPPVACGAGSAGRGTWDHDGNSTTPCIAWKTCSGTEVETSPGTATTDRTCGCAAGLTRNAQGTCECAPGTFSSNGVCTRLTVCMPGQFVSRAGNPGRDQQCSPCMAGTYSTTENAAQCTAQPACTGNTIFVPPLSVTAPRVCQPCPAGQSPAPGTNPERCVSPTPTSCERGSSLVGGVCTPCRAGSYCAGGTAASVACGTNNWDDDARATTPCVPFQPCPCGVSVPGTAITDNVCRACTMPDAGPVIALPDAN